MKLLRKLLRIECLLLGIVLLCSQFQDGTSHGTMVKPPQRGVTNGFKYWGIPIYDKWARTDWYAHFPAGDKSPFDGAGLFSQIRGTNNSLLLHLKLTFPNRGRAKRLDTLCSTKTWLSFSSRCLWWFEMETRTLARWNILQQRSCIKSIPAKRYDINRCCSSSTSQRVFSI